MFEREIKLNQFELDYFDKVVADIPGERFAEPGVAGGHPPVWIVGHLAVVGEMSLQLATGKPAEHPDWLPLFGPGSSDVVPQPERFAKDDLVAAVTSSYTALHRVLPQLSPEFANQPHPLPILKGTPIETNADLLAHALTSHFALHLGQLSGWRRAAGHGPLF